MAVDTLDLGLPHLNVVDTIGRGGFSVVYKAIDAKLNRPVAVKVLTAVADRSDLERFEQECQIHGPLSNHPNIITIHDAGFTPTGNPFLVMEYLDGGSLTDYLDANGPMPWQQASEWMSPICDAVETAHRMGILHRDIKPANILVAPDGPKLADFGIACVTDATSPQFAVSWLHAPPEAELNRRDERSDVYSLASTMYQLIAGHAPYWRDGDESLAALLARMATEPVPHLAADVAPPWVDQLLQRALAKDPAVRPATAAELRAALVAGPEGPGLGGTQAAVPGQRIDDQDLASQPTTVLPTATEILPAVALHPAGVHQANDPRASTANPNDGLVHSGSAGGGSLVDDGPYVATGGSGSPTTAGGSVQYAYPAQHGHPVQHGHAAQHRGQAAPRRASAASGRRSKKLPVVAAIVAIATVAFFLSPALAAFQPEPARGAATNGSATSTTVDSATSVAANSSTTETDEGSPDTTTETTETSETSDTTDDTDTSDTTDDTDTSDTTDDTSETTDPTPPPSPDVEVPNVTNLTADEAAAVLGGDGFTDILIVEAANETVDEGLVIGTDPSSGSLVDPDDEITLRVSTGPSEPDPVTVPDVLDASEAAATSALEDEDLEVLVVEVELDDGDPQLGTVLDVDPGVGTSVAVGSTVTIVVGVAADPPPPTIDPIIVPPVITIPSTTLGFSR